MRTQKCSQCASGSCADCLWCGLMAGRWCDACCVIVFSTHVLCDVLRISSLDLFLRIGPCLESRCTGLWPPLLRKWVWAKCPDLPGRWEEMCQRSGLADLHLSLTWILCLSLHLLAEVPYHHAIFLLPLKSWEEDAISASADHRIIVLWLCPKNTSRSLSAPAVLMVTAFRFMTILAAPLWTDPTLGSCTDPDLARNASL